MTSYIIAFSRGLTLLYRCKGHHLAEDFARRQGLGAFTIAEKGI